MQENITTNPCSVKENWNHERKQDKKLITVDKGSSNIKIQDNININSIKSPLK